MEFSGGGIVRRVRRIYWKYSCYYFECVPFSSEYLSPTYYNQQSRQKLKKRFQIFRF